MLVLKKIFPQDKIINKLIVNEFTETKIAKNPLEYDVHDQDQENKMK